MARRIVRGSRFRVGQRVIVDGDYNCDYFGRVVNVQDSRVSKSSRTMQKRGGQVAGGEI